MYINIAVFGLFCRKRCTTLQNTNVLGYTLGVFFPQNHPVTLIVMLLGPFVSFQAALEW
jgi:hypothetical protein